MPISEAERVIMEALWRKHPLATEEIHAKVSAKQGWTLGTVKKLMNRLMTKGAVSVEREGRRYLFSPALSRSDFLTTESEKFLDRLFGGKIAPFVTHFTERKKISPKDLAELKRLVDELDHDK